MKKALWFLGAAVLLLGLALLALKRGNPDGFVFDPARVSEVVWLRVIYQGDTAELAREKGKEGRWVGVHTGETVSAARVSRALTGLLGIRAREKVSESNDPARLEEFGIGPADAKQVDWALASGEKFRVLLGKTAGTDFSSIYWKWDGKPGVYSTPGDFTFDLASEEPEWKADGPAPAFEIK